MSHEIESNFVEDYLNEEKQCQLCDSLRNEGGRRICSESGEEVPATAHCDFFRAID